jgi:hypothetical protein
MATPARPTGPFTEENAMTAAPARRSFAFAAALVAAALSACGTSEGATSLDEALAVAEASAAAPIQAKDLGSSTSTSPGITLSSATVAGGQSVTVTATVSFSHNGGVTVLFLFPGSALAGPKFVILSKGQQSASVTLVANPYLAAATTVTVMARTQTPFPATLSTAALTIVPGPAAGATTPRVTSVQLGAASVSSGTPVGAVVTLSGAAPAGGLAVQVNLSNDQFMQNSDVPSVVVVPAGATSAPFTVRTHLTTAGVTTWSDYVVANVYGGLFAGAALTVTK